MNGLMVDERADGGSPVHTLEAMGRTSESASQLGLCMAPSGGGGGVGVGTFQLTCVLKRHLHLQ